MNDVSRALFFICGVALLGFTGWNVSDGVIYFKGTETRLVDHPVWFWLEAAVFAGLAILIIYAALTSKPKDPSSD